MEIDWNKATVEMLQAEYTKVTKQLAETPDEVLRLKQQWLFNRICSLTSARMDRAFEQSRGEV